MSRLFPEPPATGNPMPATHAGQEIRNFLALRRSAGKRTLAAPGPDGSDLAEILSVAARVPDHRRLTPWRFIVFTGNQRQAFNTAAVEIQKQEDPDATESMLKDTVGLFDRAPVVVAVISSPDPTHKTPVWEQELSAGAVCHNLLLAANASGWAGCWLTEWISYSPGIAALLGLAETERVAGFIYLGTATTAPQERMRPDLPQLVQHWTG